jgi:tetratricopeptide (TPR) repeat protein
LNVDKNADVDAVWLKAKGGELKARGDYSGAINAYTDAIKADKSLVDVVASRAECFLQTRRVADCIGDCLKVLDMKNELETQLPDVNERVKFVKETRIRLGMAYCVNKEYDKAKAQFEEARELDPTDKNIEQFIGHVVGLVEASGLKENADKLFGCGDFSEAIDAYTKAIEVEPLFLPALMNRAGCYLAKQDLANSIEDSSRALELLSRGRQRNILASLLLPDSRTKRKWTVTALCRRAAAKRLDDNPKAALEDLLKALKHAEQDSDGGIDTKEIEQEIRSLRQD